jgi:5'-3' exoribonuclease 2
MAVLPSDSDHAIPTASRWLMSDPESPIIDFYPTDVPVDPNGKAMPWLWVVLLPFIDEDRLLQAMSPTMTKWTKEELLCNARGLDDGYLYVHESNPLVQNKLAMVVAKGKTARDPKTRLTQDVATAAGFSGSVRPPLSNELYPVKKANDGSSSGDDDYEPVTIPVPPTANLIDDPGPDGLFTEPIEVNTAVCVAFTEPPKLPHKSILLPGAKPPRPVLTAEDKRIRRPRFNRGGSIANLGMTAGGSSNNNNSHQQGFGSMNIGTHERDLAAQTGRGREMYQTGNRAWGAMEPTPKRFQAGVVGAPLMSNPFLNQPGGFGGHAMQQGGYERPPWNSMGAGPPNAYQHPGGQFQGGGPSYQNNNIRNQQTQPQQRQYQNGGYQQHQQQPHLFAGGRPQQQFGGGYQQQQHLPHGYNLSRQHQQQQHHQQQPQQRQGHDFRSFNHAPAVPPPPPPPHFLQQQPQQQQQRAPAQRSRANPDAVRNLREQLSSTLRNRRPGGGGQN